MKRLTSTCLLVALLAVVAGVSTSMAVDGPYYRELKTITASNVTWTVASAERPNIVRVDAVGVLPTCATVTVTCVYGDTGGGTASFSSVTTDASGNGTTSYESAPRYLQSADVITFAGPTSGVVRVHCMKRDTRPIN